MQPYSFVKFGPQFLINRFLIKTVTVVYIFDPGEDSRGGRGTPACACVWRKNKIYQGWEGGGVKNILPPSNQDVPRLKNIAFLSQISGVENEISTSGSGIPILNSGNFCNLFGPGVEKGDERLIGKTNVLLISFDDERRRIGAQEWDSGVQEWDSIMLTCLRRRRWHCRLLIIRGRIHRWV